MGWLAWIPFILAACGNDGRQDDGDDGDDVPPVCVSDHDFFEQEVWGKVMGASCIGCHTLAGAAQEQFAKFLLQPTNYPGFLDENFENARMCR
jgi:mono/diheme cytochrome c family protein